MDTKKLRQKILDLAIIFNCLVDADETGNATILIYNQHLSLWNITKDDLYHLAMKNTPALLTYELRDMSDVLIELMAGVPCNSMKEAFPIMRRFSSSLRSSLFRPI